MVSIEELFDNLEYSGKEIIVLEKVCKKVANC